jgi:exosortase
VYDNGVSKPLNIAEACSGMRMLMAFLALGVAIAYTGLKHPWQRVLLVLMAVPTSIFVNILRVCTLALLSLIDSGFAAGDFHSFVGLVWLLPALFIYLGLMWIIRNLVIEQETP